jgi:hypothetical protein
MIFVPLKETLNDWAKKKDLKKFFNSDKVIQLVNQYLKEQQKWPLNSLRAISFSRENLTILGTTKEIVADLKKDEANLKLYLGQQLPEIKINKIIYKQSR